MQIPGVTSGSGTTGSSSIAGSVLAKDDFLHLLTAQLRYQNPLAPVEDADFAAQMAQFSALEQMGNVADGLERLSFAAQVSESVALIGRTIEWEKDGAKASGVVESVTIESGVIRLHVGEDEVEPGQVARVE